MDELDGQLNVKLKFQILIDDLHAYRNHLEYDPQHIAFLGSLQSMGRNLDLLLLLLVQQLQPIQLRHPW